MMQYLSNPVNRSSRAGGVWDYVSVSRLNLWLKCPLAFKLKYLDGVAAPPSPSQFLGRRVHAALEYYYRQRMLSAEPTTEQIAWHLRRDWESALGNEGCPFGNDASAQAACDEAYKLVAAYLAAKPAEEGTPLAVENALRLPLIDASTGSDLGIPLVGVVDLVLDGSSGPIIIDFKTAARGGRPADLLHELQLSAYSYLIRQATGRQEQALEIRQIVKASRPRLERYCYSPRTSQQMRRLFAVIRAYLGALDRREFYFRPGLTCNSCEFVQTYCQQWAA